MRKTVIAAAASLVLSSAAQAHAEIDTIKFNTPACITTLHLDEGIALYQAGRPINQDTCLMLRGGTEVVRVNRFSYYAQIAYQIGGQTYTLFVRDVTLASVVSPAELVSKARQDDADANAFMDKHAGLDPSTADELRKLWRWRRDCQRQTDSLCAQKEQQLQALLLKYGYRE